MQHILPERTCPITERRNPIDGLLLRLVEAGHDGLHELIEIGGCHAGVARQASCVTA